MLRDTLRNDRMCTNSIINTEIKSAIIKADISYHIPILLIAKVKAYRNSWALDARVGRWTLDSGHWTVDAGLWALDSGRWTLDSEPWTLNSGSWTMDTELWTLDAGLRMPGSGRWTLDS